MTEPTDRERVAWALCEATDTANPHCGMSVPCPDCLRLADAAIALGAKPPVDPVEELGREVVSIWLREMNASPFEYFRGDVQNTGLRVARHVIARAKEMGL